MSRRSDAVVFRIDLGAEEVRSSAPVRARAERTLDGTRHEKSLWSRLRTVQRFRKIKRTFSSIKGARAAFAEARAGLAASAEGGIARVGARAAASPVGLIATALIVAGVTALRLATGQPLEGTGEAINRMMFGDMDDEARARMGVGAKFDSDHDLLRIGAQSGGVNPQVAAVAKDLTKLELDRQKGASLFREKFASNNLVDMLILRGRDAIVAGWQTAGGPSALDSAHRGYSQFALGMKGR